ncbi:MAG TPA: methyltransferase domain-containing protein [Polyangiaceae bacterium]|jgi:ubiquinone/menaquinone biosynthesis C-methylase UbiE
MSGKIETGWGSREFAESWKKQAETRNRMMAAATERMFTEARVVSGARVLDLGTGTGDTALFAAERVGPSGSVTATDASPSMVEAAAAAVRAVGAKNVTVRAMDATQMDLPASSFDAVIARHVLMFLDIPRAVAEVRRVLRPGGRLAATVWGPLAQNPFHRIVIDAASRRAKAGWGESVPEVVRAFSVPDPEAWRRALVAARFDLVVVESLPVERRFESAMEALESVRASPILSGALGVLPEAERASAWMEIESACRGFETTSPGAGGVAGLAGGAGGTGG